jgi:hypothetical protein
MKKLLVAWLTVFAIVMTSFPAKAMEVKFSGEMRVRGEVFYENPFEDELYDEADDLSDDEVRALYEELNGKKPESGQKISTKNNTSSLWDSRMRLQLDLVASDNLKGVYQLEIGDIVWGGNGNDMLYLVPNGNIRDSEEGGGLATDGVNVETRYLYIDFNLFRTQLNTKVGLMPIKLGHGFLFDETAAALLLSVDLDPVTVGVFTMKAAEDGLDNYSDVDYFGLYADAMLKHLGTVGIFGVYGRTRGDGVNEIIHNSAENPEYYNGYDAQWVGLTLDLSLDLLTVAFEADYYNANYDADHAYISDFDAEGWLAYLDAGVNLEQVRFVIAGLYATGNNNNEVGNNRGEAFTPILPTDPEDACVVNWDNMYVLDIKRNIVDNLISGKIYASIDPIEKLSTGLSVQGYWLEEDRQGSGKGMGSYAGTEIDLDASYNIYEQLTYSIQAAYMFTDNEVFGLELNGKEFGNNDIWFLGHKLTYSF